MATNEYLKPNDPIRQSVYPDEMIRADGTVRNPEYQKDASLGWIWAGVAIAALAIIAFTFFGNDTRQEIPPSSVTTTTPATPPAPAADTTSNAAPAATTPSPGATTITPGTPAVQPPGVNDPSASPAVRPAPVSPDTPPSNR